MILYRTNVRYASGQVAAHLAVDVYLRGTDTHAELFADINGNTPVSNPVLTDETGNVSFYLENGLYDLEAYGSRVPFDITSIGDGSALLAQVTELQIDLDTHLASPEPHPAATSGRNFGAWFNAGIV